jgi:hypothetical protein
MFVDRRIYHCLFNICVLSFVALPPALSFAQQTQSPNPPHIGDINSDPGEDEARARIRQDMEKRAAKERVAALKHDTDKLLKLSQDLKDSVDKANENVLSLDVIKRAEEIEKLAHSVKEKMKGPN